MAPLQITVDREVVQGLFAGDDGLARLVESVVNQILSAQVAEQLGAGRYARTEVRQGYRNGIRERTIKTRLGTLTLEVPQVRNGEFSTELVSRYQRSEQALVLALMEMVVNGVSTRRVKRITEELCGASFAKSTVSDLCKALDPLVKAWRERPLGPYPFVIVDALVIRVRKEEHLRQMSALVAVGVNTEGRREIIGLGLGDSESEASWSAFFAALKERGLSGVDLIVSDDHQGLVKAVRRHFQGAIWQSCQTHLARNVLDVCPKADQRSLHSRLRLIFEAPDMTMARTVLEETIAAYGTKAAKAMQRLEADFDDAVAVLTLPEPHRERLRTTNGLERLNEEVHRRENAIRIFPNEVSALHLLEALLKEQDETWSTGRRYLTMQACQDLDRGESVPLPERGNAA